MVVGDPNLEGMEPGAEAKPEKAIEGRSLKQIALARLRRDKATLLAMFIAALYVLTALFSPLLDKIGVINAYDQNQNLLGPDTTPKGSFGGISASHPLGIVPGTGTDMLSRLMVGVTYSVVIGLGATLVAILIGLAVGLLSGFLGGIPDFWLSRFVDLVLCFPQTLMLLALSGTITARLVSLGVPEGNTAYGLYVILVLGLFGWPTFARIIRGQVLTLRNREFVEAARSLGAKNGRLYVKELLPNLWAPILVYATLLLPVFVSAEAALSYLGVGIKPPTPTLGNIITDSVNYAQSDATYFFAPVITIAVLVLSFNLVGDGLRDALDPKGDRR